MGRYRSKKDRDGFVLPANGPRDPLRPEYRERTGNRKDTRRWCRGKKGVEHTPETRIDKPSWWTDENGKEYCHYWTLTRIWICRHQVVCTTCGWR